LKWSDYLMKKMLIMITILLGVFVLSGCTSHSFFYDYDELMQGLVKVEIIYMENEVVFFDTHWYVDIQSTDYEVKEQLSLDEVSALISALSDVRFTYTQIWLPASVSSIFSMQGYALRLYYGDDQFIILAQTGDYRYGLPRFAQIRAGRRATDGDWNDFINQLYELDSID